MIYLTELEGARAKAVENLDRANDLVRYAVFDLHDQLKDIGRLSILEGVSRRAADYFDSLPTELVEATPIRDRVGAYRNLANAIAAAGDRTAAIEILESAAAQAKNSNERGFDECMWVDCQIRIAALEQLEGGLDALPRVDRALEVVRHLHAASPDDSSVQLLLAQALSVRANLLVTDFAERRACTDELIEILSAFVGGVDETDQALSLMISARMGKFSRNTAERRHEGELELAEGTLELAERLRSRHPQRPEANRQYAHALLALSTASRQDPERSITLHQQGEQVLTSLVEADPKNQYFARELALASSDGAVIFRRFGRHEESLEAFRRSFAQFEAHAELDPENLSTIEGWFFSNCMIVVQLTATGDRDSAEAHLLTSVEPRWHERKGWSDQGYGVLVRAYGSCASREATAGFQPFEQIIRSVEVGTEGLLIHTKSAVLGIVLAKHALPLSNVAPKLTGDNRERARKALLGAAEALSVLQPPAAKVLTDVADDL